MAYFWIWTSTIGIYLHLFPIADWITYLPYVFLNQVDVRMSSTYRRYAHVSVE